MDISEFQSVFEARRQHCRALLALSGRQSELIDADDYTQLLVVLGRKQELIGCLEQLKRRYPDLLGQWKACRDSAEAGFRRECERILAETEHILKQLVEQEQQSTEYLTQRRDETQQQLRQLTRGAGTNRAYRDALAPATSRHLDVNS